MIYSQRNPQWSNEKLGFGTGTIGQYGCKVVSIAQGLLRFGINYDPSSFNKLLQANNLYTGTTKNLVNDVEINRLSFVESYVRKDAFTTLDLATLLKDHVVVGEVSATPIGGSAQHFVGIDSVDGANAIITDPWFGDKIKVAQRYGNYGNIKSLRVYKVKGSMDYEKLYNEARVARDSHWANMSKLIQATGLTFTEATANAKTTEAVERIKAAQNLVKTLEAGMDRVNQSLNVCNTDLQTEKVKSGSLQIKLTECEKKPIVTPTQPVPNGRLNGYTKQYTKDGVVVTENYAIDR